MSHLPERLVPHLSAGRQQVLHGLDIILSDLQALSLGGSRRPERAKQERSDGHGADQARLGDVAGAGRDLFWLGYGCPSSDGYGVLL